MNTAGGVDFDAWHKLFDALCNRRGWYDNNDLASALCVRLGKSSRQDFEAAKKKLRAWRAGQRLPLRRNLATLAQLLELENDPELERRWLALYRRATAAHEGEDTDIAAQATSGEGRLMWGSRVLAGFVLLLGSGAVYAAIANSRHAALAALPQVNFEGYVRVPVGASHLIHGAVESCDSEVPEWEEIAPTLPETPYGTLTDGGLARKLVWRCREEKLVRAVRFTGVALGTAELRLFGDYIKVDVVSIQPEAASEGE